MWLSRRRMFQLGLAASGATALGSFRASAPLRAADVQNLSPDDALQMLLDGNQRYAAGAPHRPNQTSARRAEVAAQQTPFAAVLACADSRVTPEFIFDAGIGDIFVPAVAGNFPAPPLTGSLEYAVDHFATPLIMVLGHSRCGAAIATVDAVTMGGDAPGQIGSIVQALQPAVLSVIGQPGDVVENAVRANVAMGVQALRSAEPILAGGIRAGTLNIVGAVYDLDTGKVELTVV